MKERKGNLLEVSVLCTFKKVKKVATLPPEEPLRSEGQHDILEVWGELEPAQRDDVSRCGISNIMHSRQFDD